MESFNMIIDRAEDAKAVVVIHHGFAEHTGRYEHETDYLVEEGYHVVRFDAREHGKNSLKVSSYASFVEDLNQVIDLTHETFKGMSVFLWGHSMGGLMSTLYAQKFPQKLAGLMLTSPAIGELPEVEGFSKYLLKIAATILPNGKINDPVKKAVVVDDHLLQRYENDEYLLKSTRFGFMYQFLVKAQEAITYHLEVPLLLLQGDSDQIVPIACGGNYFDKVDQVDKKRIVYKHMGHELTNEPNYEEILSVMIAWMKKESID